MDSECFSSDSGCFNSIEEEDLHLALSGKKIAQAVSDEAEDKKLFAKIARTVKTKK